MAKKLGVEEIVRVTPTLADRLAAVTRLYKDSHLYYHSRKRA